jgi:MFS family permease
MASRASSTPDSAQPAGDCVPQRIVSVYLFAALRGIAASVLLPVGIAVALRSWPAWVENVPLTDQVRYFGVNYSCPAAVFILLGIIAGRIAPKDIDLVTRRDVFYWSLFAGVGFVALVVCFKCFNSHQGFFHLEHVHLTAMALPNAIFAGAIAGRYVLRRKQG